MKASRRLSTTPSRVKVNPWRVFLVPLCCYRRQTSAFERVFKTIFISLIESIDTTKIQLSRTQTAGRRSFWSSRKSTLTTRKRGRADGSASRLVFAISCKQDDKSAANDFQDTLERIVNEIKNTTVSIAYKS